MEKRKQYDLQKRLVKFSASVIVNASALKKEFASEHLIKQLIRSSTSAALNYGEAQSAESKRMQRIGRYIYNKYKNIKQKIK